MRKGLTRFIYKGFYYPVIGNSSGFSSKNTAVILDKVFGGIMNWKKWWSFSYGIKCYIFNPDKPYRQKIIDRVKDHPEMNIRTVFIDTSNGQEISKLEASLREHTQMISVYHVKGNYIGDIADAYRISNLTELRDSSGRSKNTVAVGWNEDTETAYGWSHRAIVGFKRGDKMFEEDFGDDKTLFTEHGTKTIETKRDALKSARAFAKYVS